MRRTLVSGIVVALALAGGEVLGPVPSQAQGGGTARPHYLLALASTNATVVSGCRPIDLVAAALYTIDATPVYVRFYDRCSTPDETHTPVLVLVIPGSATLGQTVFQPSRPVHFATGLAFRTTTGIAVNNTDAVAASEVILNLAYQ